MGPNNNLGGFGSYSGTDNVGDVVLSSGKKNSFSSKRKTVFIILFVVFIVLFVIIVGVSVFLFLKNDRERKNALAEDFYESVGWVGYSMQCPSVVNYVNDSGISSIEYKAFIDSCREDDKKIRDFISQAATLDASQEYKELYANLLTAVSESVVVGEDLEKAVNIYQAWHDWIIALENISDYQTPEDIEQFASVLTQLNNDELLAYTEKWIASRQRLVDAFMRADILPSDQSVLDEYEMAKESYLDVLDTVPDFIAITGLGRDTSNDSASRIAIILYNDYLKENL